MIFSYLFCLAVLLKYVKTETCSCRDNDVDKKWKGPILKQTDLSSLNRDECIGVTKDFPKYYLSTEEVNVIKKMACDKKDENIKVFETGDNFSGKKQVSYLTCEVGTTYHLSVLEQKKDENDILYLKRCETEYVSEDGTVQYVNTNLKNADKNVANTNNGDLKGIKVTIASASNAKTLYNNGYLYYICYNLVLILYINFICIY